MDPKTRLVLDDFSGGRNAAVSPLGPAFQSNQVVDAVNVDWYRTAGARKRHGTANISMTGSGITTNVSWLGRFMPGISEANAELWAAEEIGAGTPQFARLDNSATWVTVAYLDFLATIPWEMTCASLNGFFFLAYYNAAVPINRLHVYDPPLNTIRRAGLSPGTPVATAPTVANTGAGAYAATLRYYRIRFHVTPSLFSEPTLSVAFTPSGAGTAARVTRPAVINEGETHWRLEGSADNVTFYALADIAIATTTYDDTTAPANYSAGAVSPLTGMFTTQKAYRFIAADSNRLLGFGAYDPAEKQSRLWISAVVGSRDQGDAERVDTTSTYYYDFDEKNAGAPTALVGPLFGNFYPFLTRQFWELSPTGVVADPYRRTPISKELGCVSAHAAQVGEDAAGHPCLYFMSHRGVYRYGSDGLTYISHGIEDLLLGPTSLMNMASTNAIAHLVYHPEKRQLWVWWATGSSNDPDALAVLNVMTGGWARYTGTIAQARCSVMFARSIGASMGFALTPYIGSTTAVNRVTRVDDTTVTQDAGVSYQATITTKPLEPAGAGMRGDTGDAIVLAPAASGVTLTATITPDFGAAPASSGTALLTASGAGESRVSKRLEGSALGGSQFVQITIGDGAAADNTWAFDRVIIPLGGQEPVS